MTDSLAIEAECPFPLRSERKKNLEAREENQPLDSTAATFYKFRSLNGKAAVHP